MTTDKIKAEHWGDVDEGLILDPYAKRVVLPIKRLRSSVLVSPNNRATKLLHDDDDGHQPLRKRARKSSYTTKKTEKKLDISFSPKHGHKKKEEDEDERHDKHKHHKHHHHHHHHKHSHHEGDKNPEEAQKVKEEDSEVTEDEDF